MIAMKLFHFGWLEDHHSHASVALNRECYININQLPAEYAIFCLQASRRNQSDTPLSKNFPD